jgi:hypothetical protein
MDWNGEFGFGLDSLEWIGMGNLGSIGHTGINWKGEIRFGFDSLEWIGMWNLGLDLTP